jgi:Ca2+-binding EF-hand superfamily protein
MKEFEKRFGLTAVGKGFITLDQLTEAMKIQIKGDTDRAVHIVIGEILMEMGALNASQVMEVLNTMDKNITSTEKIKTNNNDLG